MFLGFGNFIIDVKKQIDEFDCMHENKALARDLEGRMLNEE